MRAFAGCMGVLSAGLVLLVATGCRSMPSSTPLTQLNPQQLHGHEVFQVRCAVCHYDRQKGDLHGPSLFGLYRKPALPSGAAATDERVTATILRGRGMMPAMGGRLEPGELDDLVLYLHTL